MNTEENLKPKFKGKQQYDEINKDKRNNSHINI